MSGYIRTKDGRIGKFYQDQSFTITCSLGCIDKENILNQADTIEELCDGYIIESKNNPAIWFEMTCEEFNIKKPKAKNNWVIYAYIKTNKGLIYKAKMNDKGELELL